MPRAGGRHSVAVMRHHSMKMMWGCVAIVALVVVLAVAASDAGFLLFALPCTLMMGVMMGGMGGCGPGGGGNQK